VKRYYIIGLIALVLALFAVSTPAAARFIHTARNFDRQFHSLKSVRSMNPIDRVVLSLLLAS
jgi:hypothetical protein